MDGWMVWSGFVVFLIIIAFSFVCLHLQLINIISPSFLSSCAARSRWLPLCRLHRHPSARFGLARWDMARSKTGWCCMVVTNLSLSRHCSAVQCCLVSDFICEYPVNEFQIFFSSSSSSRLTGKQASSNDDDNNDNDENENDDGAKSILMSAETLKRACGDSRIGGRIEKKKTGWLTRRHRFDDAWDENLSAKETEKRVFLQFLASLSAQINALQRPQIYSLIHLFISLCVVDRFYLSISAHHRRQRHKHTQTNLDSLKFSNSCY